MEVDVVRTGDCLALLSTLPDACGDLVIADPPYNIGPQFGNRREWHHDEAWLPWCRSWLAECSRILKRDGQIFVYGIHHYIGHIQVELYNLGLQYRRLVVWHYENGWSRSTKTLATHYEPLLWFSKSASY